VSQAQANKEKEKDIVSKEGTGAGFRRKKRGKRLGQGDGESVWSFKSNTDAVPE